MWFQAFDVRPTRNSLSLRRRNLYGTTYMTSLATADGDAWRTVSTAAQPAGQTGGVKRNIRPLREKRSLLSLDEVWFVDETRVWVSGVASAKLIHTEGLQQPRKQQRLARAAQLPSCFNG